MIENIKDHVWNIYIRLPERSQRLLLLLTLGVAGALLFLVLWLPAQQYLQRAEITYRDQKALLAWMQANIQDQVPAVNQAQLASVVRQIAQQQTVVFTELESKENEMHMKLTNVSFNAMMQWLNGLQGQGINTQTLTVTKTTQSGMVDAELTVAKTP